MLSLLFDGWALAYEPASPQALHLLAQLATLPTSVQAELALPAALPAQVAKEQPGAITLHILPTPNNAWGQLRWAQQYLPRLATRLHARAISTAGLKAPFTGQTPVLAHPAGWTAWAELQGENVPTSKGGVAPRLEAALGWGGLGRAQAVCWPEDLPLPTQERQKHHFSWRSLPTLVHPLFTPGAALPPPGDQTLPDLPEAYILYHGPTQPADLKTLAACWSWAAGPVGTDCPLVIYGVEPANQPAAQSLFQQAGLVESICLVPPLGIANLARLYHGCRSVLLLGSASPWGCPLRHALACGKPVVAAENLLNAALAGPAAFLQPADAPRLLGAALISVEVDENLAESLSAAAQGRAAGWQPEKYWQALLREARLSTAG